jgi:hypothetical protein
MTTKRQGVLEEEPVGIVISRGSRAEPLPRVLAYIWGPVPDGDEPVVDVRAA